MLSLLAEYVVIFLWKTYYLYVYTDVSLLQLLVTHNLKIQPAGMFCNVHA